MRPNCLLVILAALLLLPAAALARNIGDSSQSAELLLVQSADGAAYSDGELVLRGVHGAVYFADRPYRFYGHLDNVGLLELWAAQAGAVAAVPPNATLAVPGDDAAEYVLRILGPPDIERNRHVYRVQPLSAPPPAELGPCNLFIDAFPTPVNGQITD